MIRIEQPQRRRRQARTALVALAILATLGAAAGQTVAQTAGRQIDSERAAQIEQRLEEIRARLDLTPEQQAQLEPILRESFQKRMQVLSTYGLDGDRSRRLSMREVRSLRAEMDTLRKETDRQVATVLDTRQMAEFKKIQDEAREQLRERLRNRK